MKFSPSCTSSSTLLLTSTALSLALVGSAARGEQRENSDIDVCVKLRKTTFRAYMTIKEELEHLFHTKS